MNIGWLYNKSIYKGIGGTERTTMLAIDMLQKVGHKSYAFIIVNENDNTFSLIRNMEFLNDRSFAIMYRWNLNGKLLNRIPLIKKLKWRENIGFNMMWGYLSDKNNPFRFNDTERYPDEASKMADPGYEFLYNMPGEWVNMEDGTRQYQPITQIMNSWKPNVGLNIGLSNLWKFFSVDYYHRLTYNRPGTQTWGIRFAFEASF